MTKILVADDSATIQKVIKIAFARLTYEMLEATSYPQAANIMLQPEAPSLMILDANLPGLHGPEGIQKLLGPQKIPVLLLVGSYDTVNEDVYRQAGFQHFLRKPFESIDIVTYVEKLLSVSDKAPSPPHGKTPPPMPGGYPPPAPESTPLRSSAPLAPSPLNPFHMSDTAVIGVTPPPPLSPSGAPPSDLGIPSPPNAVLHAEGAPFGSGASPSRARPAATIAQEPPAARYESSSGHHGVSSPEPFRGSTSYGLGGGLSAGRSDDPLPLEQSAPRQQAPSMPPPPPLGSGSEIRTRGLDGIPPGKPSDRVAGLMDSLGLSSSAVSLDLGGAGASTAPFEGSPLRSVPTRSDPPSASSQRPSLGVTSQRSSASPAMESPPPAPAGSDPGELAELLDLIRGELPALVSLAVKEYCEQHFAAIAREVITAELRRLIEEKSRHLVDN